MEDHKRKIETVDDEFMHKKTDAMYFAPPEVNYEYDVCKWKALNVDKQLQCFCSTAMKKASPGADIMQCKDCGFSLSIKAISACLANKVFLQWPLMQVPVCRACNQVGLRAYGKDKMGLTFACKCPRGETKYFRTNDGNAKCWDTYIDTIKANKLDMTVASVVSATGEEIAKKDFKKQDMF
jgi:hypothetical protein